ncbi:hypothetical protein IKF15_02860 [Candidatus Saccharibacteria bacterium]|nr:hypothetical protein [Candidatus Saccharibacteria bacterium]
MRQYKDSKYVIYQHDFRTLSEFLRYNESLPVNKEVFGRCASKEYGRKEWHGTRNYEEAEKLCRNGWNEGYEKFVRMKRKVDLKFNSVIPRPRLTTNFVGFAPSVPDYLNNNPLDMNDTEKRDNPRAITIYVQLGFHCETDLSAVMNRGVIILSIVDALEKCGLGVRLKTFVGAVELDEAVIVTFELHKESERLNIKRMYFPLCHVAFVRRLFFRLLEVTPVRRSYWSLGYGRPMEVCELRSFLELGANDIVIPQPDSTAVYGRDIDRDCDKVLELTGLDRVLKRSDRK